MGCSIEADDDGSVRFFSMLAAQIRMHARSKHGVVDEMSHEPFQTVQIVPADDRQVCAFNCV